MDSATDFYQTLTGTSFTLLGLWFGVMQFGHGDWRGDPRRHRSTIHIALHFFLPGMLGMGSLRTDPLGREDPAGGRPVAVRRADRHRVRARGDRWPDTATDRRDRDGHSVPDRPAVRLARLRRTTPGTTARTPGAAGLRDGRGGPGPRRASRRTNLGLLALLGLSFATGVLAFAVGTLPAATVTGVVHGALGLGLLVLIPWKTVVVRRARRAGRGRLLGTLLLVLVPACVLAGVLHAVDGYRVVGGITALQVHVGTALALVPFVVGHVLAHPQRVRRTDLSRRALLRTAGVVSGAAAAYVVVDAGSAVVGTAGADDRGTGSTEVGSGTPLRMPVTQWISDDVPRLGEDHVVRIAGRSVLRRDLDGSDQVTATLDCTGGWYAEQVWSGTRLDRVLGELPADGCLEVESVTGYTRRFPLSDAPRLWLATRAAGEALSAGHGAPVRLVAPGRRGFWWVKWVAEVRVVDSPWWWQSPFPLQ